MTGVRERSAVAGKAVPSRRQFLGRAGRLGIGVLGGVSLSAGKWGDALAALTAARTDGSPALYALVLNGSFAGLLGGFRGGEATAEVVTEQVGADFVQRKQLGRRWVEPMTLHAGLPMSHAFYAWIKSGIEPAGLMNPLSGSILELDSSLRVLARRSFENARVAKVEFPACDPSSRIPARIAVTCFPESVAVSLGGGQTVAQAAARQAFWLGTSFRLQIQGLEKPALSARRVESIVVSRMASPATVGVTRTTPPTIEVANLRVTIHNSAIQPFYAWHRDLVVKGGGPELLGFLEYRSSAGAVLLGLNFFNLGIVKISPAPPPSGRTVSADSIVEMYCEAVTCDFAV
jgi:hypothetical protein